MDLLQQDQKSYHPLFHLNRIILVLLSLFHCMITVYAAHPTRHNPVESLLLLKQSFTNSTALSSWAPSRRPCFGPVNLWVGLICSKGGSVYGLWLENMGLSGKIDMDALQQLPRLRTISFRGNNFSGPLPKIKKIKPLKAIYLSNNSFGGTIEDRAFEGMNWMKKVYLANNKLRGKIPNSLTELPKLTELHLEGNRFEGGVPDFNKTSFRDLSLANNRLEGPIPASLSKMNPTVFAGNKGLCGMPLKPCPTPWDPDHNHPAPPDESTVKSYIIPIAISVAVLLLIALLIIALVLRKRTQNSQPGPRPMVRESPVGTSRDMENGDDQGCSSSSMRGKAAAVVAANIGSSKLTFVREMNDEFDLPDLLKASAEILGSGCFGASYKASLVSAPTMVVKRFKQMSNVGKEEFHEHLSRLGKLEHKNLLPVLAYYYRKEEKLVVSEFVKKGSLANHLHGRGQPMLEWSTRLKIIKGVARGLQYLYKELPITISPPHGHLKSSNVLLDETFNPLLNDHGLTPVINKTAAKNLMAAYKSPEFFESGQINNKTDVWCLGILIVETLTGEFPAEYLQQGGGVDLTMWVKTAVDEEKGNEVFDKNMAGSMMRNNEKEMRKMLEIGLACCETEVEKRLGIDEACERIEDVKERDHDDDFYSSYTADYDGRRSTRGLSDEFNVIDS